MLTHEEMTEYLFLEVMIPRVMEELKEARELKAPQYKQIANLLLKVQRRKHDLGAKFIGVK